MKHEFKVTKSKEQTVYTIEAATGGSSSSGDVTTVDTTLGGMQRRNPPGDNILAQEKKETPKPRNFVAKNAKMGGAGQHKDKKKAEKQGDVKHKKPLAESSYAEDLAKQVFDANPNIKDENAVLDAAWPIAVQDLGNKRAMSVFNYDEDFPSDLVSVYGWLQKDQQGVAEKIDSRFRKTEWIPIADALKILKHYGATIEEWGGHFHFAYYDREGVRKRIEDLTWNADDTRNVRLSILNQAVRELKAQQQGVAEGFNGEYDDEAGMAHTNLLTSARAVMGLLKTIEDKDNLPEWVQEKIAKAEMMLVGVWDYLQSQKEQGIDPQQDMEETSSYHNNRTGFSRGPRDDERHDLDPSDWYIVKDGKMYKTSVYPRQEQEALSRGYSRTREEANAKANNVEEDDSALQAFLSKGGKVDRLPYKEPKTKDKANWGSKHIGTGKGGKAQNASGLGANTRVGNKPVVSVEEDAYMTAKKESTDTYFESLTNMLERSVSQAQHNLMVGVANNPQFAQKVKVKQNVGQEFANADQGHDISKLPIRVPKKK